jgi:hypothetical protein
MSFHSYVNNIGFRLVKPDTPLLPIGFDRFTQRLRISTLFEAFNTQFPDRRMKERLRGIAHMPRMSTLAIGGIINEGVRQMAPQQTFVNIGVQNQLLGLDFAEPFFAEGCHILIDDTNHDPVRRGTLDFLRSSTHEYRVILDKRTYCNAHPTFWNGIMLLQHVSGNSSYGIGEGIDR